jgi:hypothetical protein
MGIPIDPELAENYQGLVDDGLRTWKGILKMAEDSGDAALAAHAREQASAKGQNVTPADAVPSYKNTRSKGQGKAPDGIGEPPISIDKVTPGTRFPDVAEGDVTPTTVDPTGANPSTAAEKVQAHPDEPLPAAGEVKRSTTTAAPDTVEEAQAAYNGPPDPPSQR